MNTTFRFIIAAMAAIAVIASCQKEFANETVKGSTDGIRVISAQFDHSTKAALNGNTPSFTDQDLIRVSNNEKSEVCTLSVSESAIKFTTTLPGKLTAIYPAGAAALTSEEADAPIKESDNIKVSATQDGTIANAIIAMATVEEGQSSAIFNVQTALFVITPPDGEKSFTITSLKPVVDNVKREGDAVAINTDQDKKTVITVSNNDLTTFYVSLVPNVKLSDLSFEYTTDETHGAMKGISINAIKAQGKADKTEANYKYIIDEKGWHPYVKIGNLKWATENIGATDTNPYGTYFAWADTVGHELKAENFGKTGTISSAFDHDFSGANCPFGDGSTSKFKKYVSSGKSSYLASGFSGDNKSVLDLADDAAYVNWGGPWRMPTGGKGDELGSSTPDFTALAKACKSDYSGSSTFYTSTINSSGASLSQGIHYYNVRGETVGVYFVEARGNKLFFPAAGNGDGTDLFDAGSNGYYWSRTLYSSNPDYAYSLGFNSGDVCPQRYYDRYLGFPVRPVSDQ